MSWRFHLANPWSWFALSVRSKSLSSNNISKVEAAQTMFSCPLGKAVSLVSSFGSVGVGYSSSLGHFLITAVKGGVEATRS
ncbi:hypothetical protein VNO77_46905 [Canavalia gladiata]|uniref:Uncharacterized protein n=1 Tax=Canavalia gladiata TaxID=3824 RepID=A0AAN9PH37_CANGL